MVDSWLLFGHLVGVAGLITAVGLESFIVVTARKATTVTELRVVSRGGKILSVLSPVALLLILVFGMAMVGHDSTDFSMGDAWVVAALCLLVFIGAVDGAVVGRRGTRLDKAVAAAPDGPVPDDVARLAQDPVLQGASRVVGVAVVEALWLMAIKPSVSGTIVSLVIAAVLGAGAVLSTRKTAA